MLKISEYIMKKAKEKRARIAIGLVKVTDGIIDSLNRASEYADIVVVGEKVEGFENIISPKPEEIVPQMLKRKEVNGIVRGNVEAGPFMIKLAKVLGYDKILRAAILRNTSGKEYFLTPASIFEGNSMGERLCMIKETAIFAKSMGVEPVIGVMSFYTMRGITEAVNQNIDETDYIIDKLKEDGFNSFWAEYRIDRALEEANLVVPPNGIIGNYVWRSLTKLGGAIDLGDFGLIPEVFVDDSAYWDDYCQPIIFAVALVNRSSILK